jgi:hypothetical protein
MTVSVTRLASVGAEDTWADGAAPGTIRAITSPLHTRVHHDELAGRVLDLMASHPA